MSVAIKSDSNKGEAEKFRQLALRYVEIGAKEGINVVPFTAPDMPLFEAAGLQERKDAIDFLTAIVNIHEETLAAGFSAINSKKLLWRALVNHSLIPGSDIFDRFTDEDVVIIYQANQTILFWNLQFFRYSNLTVEQMFFSAWHTITKRDPEIQKKLYQMAVDVITGKITGTFIPDVPGHEVLELDTVNPIRTWMELPWVSVLNKDGAFGGILVVQKMTILN